MTSITFTDRVPSSHSVTGAKALRIATQSWFAVAFIGQVIFALAVAAFYTTTAVRGDFYRWGKSISHGGLVHGDTMGNSAVVAHLLSAVVITLAGVIQLLPAVRGRWPVFHRWLGRVYMLTVLAASGAGVYMTWIRGSVGDVSQHIGATLSAVLMWVFAGISLRYAIRREIRSHRVWALRLFLVASGSWLMRIALFLIFMIYRRPVGFDPTTFTGPLLTTLTFAQYIVPLAILELYLRAQRPSAGATIRLATATLLFVLTIGTAAGVVAVTLATWIPDFKAAFDARQSIVRPIAATIASSGVNAAVDQYRQLKRTAPSVYNFDESELNSLGYQLLREKNFASAIRIFRLNIESFPKSSNAYDSLAEAYHKMGDRSDAVVNYRVAVQLNPKNLDARIMLRRLGGS